MEGQAAAEIPTPTPGTRRGASYHPAFAGVIRYEIEDRPSDDDEECTAQTVAKMARYIREDSASPIIRQAAHAAAGAWRNARKEAEAVHEWIRGHVRFVPDDQLAEELNLERPILRRPAFAEVLVRPVDLLTMPDPRGDCDDFAMLTGAMLRALGIESELRTAAAEPEDPSVYSHVYVIAHLPGRGRLALDSSHGPYPGWEVQPAGKVTDWPIEETHPMIRPATLGSTTEWLESLGTQGMNIAGSIFTARYAVPQLEPGVTIRQPNGALYTQLPAGATQAVATTATSGMSMMLIAGVVVAVVFAMTSGNRRS